MNPEVHFVPGSGLDGMIRFRRQRRPRQFIVAAVVGIPTVPGEKSGRRWRQSAPSEAAAGAPRTRAEVLTPARRLLEENLDNGLSRLSEAHQQRWATLAVSALGVNLPRLALLLRGLGDEAELFLARDARSDPGRTLSRMAQAHALCTALQVGAKARAGSGRITSDTLRRGGASRFHRGRRLALAHRVRLRRPYCAVLGTLDKTMEHLRPIPVRVISLPVFTPVGRYSQPGPWEGAESPSKLVRS